MSQRTSSLWKKADSQAKRKFIIWTSLTILFLIFILGIVTWLSIDYTKAFNHASFANPALKEQSGANYFGDKVWTNWNDFINIFGDAKAPTFAELYAEKGQEGLAWFILTSYIPTSLAAYILLPVAAIGLLVSFGNFFFKWRTVFPPLAKTKKTKTKTSKKGAKK